MTNCPDNTISLAKVDNEKRFQVALCCALPIGAEHDADHAKVTWEVTGYHNCHPTKILSAALRCLDERDSNLTSVELYQFLTVRLIATARQVL